MASPQITRGNTQPFGVLGGYVPLQRGEAALYRAIREAVPLVDACIYKIIRLCGGVTARCDAPEAERGLRDFLEQVPVGPGASGASTPSWTSIWTPCWCSARGWVRS